MMISLNIKQMFACYDSMHCDVVSLDKFMCLFNILELSSIEKIKGRQIQYVQPIMILCSWQYHPLQPNAILMMLLLFHIMLNLPLVIFSCDSKAETKKQISEVSSGQVQNEQGKGLPRAYAKPFGTTR